MILDDYQTYIGVLATFLVLCLYNTLDNFILHTILKIGEGFVHLLNRDIDQIAKTYDKIFPILVEIRQKLEQLKKEKGITRTEEEKELNRIINDVQFTKYKFIDGAANIEKGLLDKRPKSDDTTEYEKEELTYVALSSLFFIIISMVVDCMNFIPLACRSMFLIFILVFSLPLYCLFYSLFLNGFESIASKLDHPFFNPKEKKVSLRMVVGIIITFIIWLLYSCVINKEFVSLLLLPLIWLTGIYYLLYQQVYNMRIKGKQINHIFVIKHSLYVTALALVCTLTIYSLKAVNFKLGLVFQINNSALDLVCSQTVAKYSCVIMFTLNTFLLPLVFGYILMNQERNRIKNEINQIREECSIPNNELLESLNRIREHIDRESINISVEEKSITENPHANKNTQKSLEERLKMRIGVSKWNEIKAIIRRMIRKFWRKRHK